MLCLVLHAARSDKNPPARLIDFAVHVLSFPQWHPAFLAFINARGRKRISVRFSSGHLGLRTGSVDHYVALSFFRTGYCSDTCQIIMACDMGASLYEPINVYKPVAPDIGIVDGPFEYLTVGGAKLPLPFTTRMTAVRLSNGDLFLHSPIKFDQRLANGLLGLGTVRHLVSPNQFHYAHIGEWAKAFPDTVSWASPRVRQRARARHVDVDFTRDLAAYPPEEWCREIDQTLFPGGYFKEYVFFHKASKTLILTDTIINIELDKVTEPWRTATKFTGMYHPYGQIFFGMRLPLLLQPQKARAAIRKIQSWEPQRILLSHGRCFDTDADKVIRRIFGNPPR